MNRAIWKKAVSDAWLPLAVSAAILVLFSWLFVWLMGQFEVGAWGLMLRMMPNWAKSMVGVPVAELATTTGRISILYVHLVTLLVSVGWAVGRGSNSISGEIGRGTMDLILSLPIRRATVVVVPGIVASLGAAVLAGSILLGTALGLLTVDLPDDTSLVRFLPGAINLFCMTFCFIGVTVFVSSWNQDRWRTISIAGGFYIVSLIIKMVARLWEAGSWLMYGTFLSAFEPQRLIFQADETGLLAWRYNVTLLSLGLVSYVLAVVIFSYRDIPVAK